jgi:hypothetical protein
MLHEILNLLSRSVESLEPDFLDMGQKLELQSKLVHGSGLWLCIEPECQLEEFALLFCMRFGARCLRTEPDLAVIVMGLVEEERFYFRHFVVQFAV